MSKFIIISAKANHGKTTVANMIKHKLVEEGKSAYVVSYGDHVKDIARNIYDWDGTKSVEGREILQSIGSDDGKIKSNNKMYFVEHLATLIDYLFEEDDYIIIDDARFPYEIDYIKDNAGKDDKVVSMRINRTNFKSKLTEEQQKHESETSMDNYKDFDYILNNDGSYLDLVEKVDDIYKEILKRLD